jgi:hypothetical protein
MLFVKNLNYTITGEDLYDLFGRYGSIRQIRMGNEPKTKGTAFVVFDDVMDVRRESCPASVFSADLGYRRRTPSTISMASTCKSATSLSYIICPRSKMRLPRKPSLHGAKKSSARSSRSTTSAMTDVCCLYLYAFVAFHPFRTCRVLYISVPSCPRAAICTSPW